MRCLAATRSTEGGDATVYSGGQDAPFFHSLQLKSSLSGMYMEPSGVSYAGHNHWVTAALANTQYPHLPLAVISGCMDGVIRCFDADGALLGILEGHKKGVISLCWAAEGQLLSGSWDGNHSSLLPLLICLNFRERQLKSNIPPIRPCASSPRPGAAKLWDLASLTCVRDFGPQENGVHVLSLPATDSRPALVATVSTGEAINSRPCNFKLRL